jgi:hypothetical protein
MSTYDDASLVLVPSGYKNGVVFSQKPMDANGQLTFTRASSATRVGPNGYIEKVRQNVLKYSEAFDNTAQWGYSNNGTITANAIANPLNGETTADLYVVTNGAANIEKTLVSGASVFAFTAGTTYTASAYYKAGTINSQFRLLAYDGVSVQNSGIIDLVTIGNSTASYESVGDGWYRFWLTFTAQSGAGNGYIYVVNYNFVSAITNGTNVYVFGAQLEVSDFGPTPYIKTEAAAVSVGPVSGTPRLDYLGSDCPRLLLEPQRSNVVTYSEQLNNAAWTKTSAGTGIAPVVTANTSISPDGYQNADTIVFNSGAGTTSSDQSILTNSFGGQAAGAYTLSFYAKTNSGTSKILARHAARFLYTSINLTDQWQRFEITETLAASGTISIDIGLRRGLANEPLTSSVTCQIWGIQLEAGAYATSYIPTLGTAVTRVADLAQKTSASALIGQTEGTIFWEFEFTTSVATANEALLNIDNGSFGNTVYITKSASGGIVAEMYSGGVLQASLSLSSQPAGTYKAAIGYANNNTAFFVNGVQVGTTDTSCSVPAMNRIQLGNGVLGPSTDKTAQVLLFPTRLTNAQLAQLTTL